MNFFGMGFVEIVVVLAVALLVLGPNKMMEVARTMGKYARQFQRLTSDLPRLLDLEDDEPPRPPARRPRLPEQTTNEEQDPLSRG